jgi:hypothetical protein
MESKQHKRNSTGKILFAGGPSLAVIGLLVGFTPLLGIGAIAGLVGALTVLIELLVKET